MSRDVAFIPRLTAEAVPFIAELGCNIDAFMLHIYAAITQKGRRLIYERTKVGLARLKARGITSDNTIPGELNWLGILMPLGGRARWHRPLSLANPRRRPAPSA